MWVLRAILPDSSERTIGRFAGISRTVRFAAGQQVFRQGEVGDRLVIVIEGRIAVSVLSPEGSEVLLTLIDAAGMIGEVELLDGGPRFTNATAVRDTRALLLMRRDLLPLLASEPTASRSIVRLICTRLRNATSFIEDTLLLPLGARLLRRVGALAREYGRVEPGSGRMRIDHGLSQQDLGDSIGASRVSVNKQLNAWRIQGFLDFGRGFVVVHDLQRLESAAIRSSALPIAPELRKIL